MIFYLLFKALGDIFVDIKGDHNMPYKIKPPKKCKICGTFENLMTKERIHPNTKKMFISDEPLCNNPECQATSKDKALLARKATNKAKYGVENVMQLKETVDKVSAATMKNHGVSNAAKSQEIQQKKKDNSMAKYGVDHPMKRPEVVETKDNTCLEKYGFKNAIQNPEIAAYAQNTIYNKHNVLNYFASEEFKVNNSKYFMENYGVLHASQVPSMRKNQLEGMLKNQGVLYSHLSPTIVLKMNTAKRLNSWPILVDRLHHRGITPLFTKEEYVETGYTTKEYSCTHCNKTFKSDKYWKEVFCGCRKHRSVYEDQIIEWLASIGIINVESNKRYCRDNSGHLQYEIDVYLPDQNIGIDFHGLYYHCDVMQPNRDYHKQKYEYFNNLGIKFLQVFENEWVNQKPIVQSIIKNILKKNTVVHARNCEIREVSSTNSKIFLNDNHLQSSTTGSVNIGLYYKDELICLSTFGKIRYKTNKERLEVEVAGYEIYRSCSKVDYAVVGGASKILSYFIDKYKPDHMSSYVDLRYFNGNSYKTTGFTPMHKTRPNYFYFKLNNRSLTLKSRLEFQKHKLATHPETAATFNPAYSEYENMAFAGYARIFDAGNIKMVYTKRTL